MTPSELPVHWTFALAQAASKLDILIYSLDFMKISNTFAYSGVNPTYLLKVIDGFLGEDCLLGGTRNQLQNLRGILLERVGPAFEEGLAEGSRQWRNGDQVFGSISVAQLHRLALDLAPKDSMTQGWFMEGFCFAYTQDEINSIRINER